MSNVFKIYTSYMNKNQSLEIAGKYYASESEELGLKFEEMVRQKKFRFDINYSSQVDLKKVIAHIKYTHTLDDAFAVVHEGKHIINYVPDKSIQDTLFCEISTILAELRLGEFLKTTALKEVTKSEISNILYDNYDAIKSYNCDFRGARIKDYSYKEVNARIKYLIGLLLSIYINKHVNNGNIDICDYAKIRDHLEHMPLRDLSNILDMGISIDQGILNISDNDLMTLEKTYKLEMQRLTRKEDGIYEKCRNCS